MRISTSQIYDSGIRGMQRNQSALLKLQNQISSETKILTPADDPVAAAQVLVVSQSLAVEEQYQVNQKSAISQLGLVDNKLTAVTSALQEIRDSILKAGNGSYTNTDRQSVADDIESSLSEILGLANSDNGAGDYLFSGYQGGTLPFAIDSTQPAQPPATTSPMAYFGDDGQRQVQVSSSRQIAVSVPGSDVFMNGKNGNGTFVATTAGNDVGVSAAAGNTGTVKQTGWSLDRAQWDAALANTVAPLAALPLEVRFIDAANYEIIDSAGISSGSTAYTSGAAIALTVNGVNYGAQIELTGVPVAGDRFAIAPNINQGTAIVDAGSVRNTQKWSAAVNDATVGTPLEIRFSVVGGVTSYGIYDPVSGATSSPLKTYTPGQAIPLVTASGVDFGAQVVVTGAPANGDTLTVTPSSSQSVFQTVQSLLGSLRSAVGSTSYSQTQLTNDLAGALSNIDQAMLQIGQVQSAIGTSEREIDSLGSTSSDLVIQYKSTLSNLQDLDYTKALSDFTMQQVALEAAQKSFVQISGLSLFDYL